MSRLRPSSHELTGRARPGRIALFARQAHFARQRAERDRQANDSKQPIVAGLVPGDRSLGTSGGQWDHNSIGTNRWSILMFTPRPVALQRGALRLDPLTETDIPSLVEIAERNRDELIYLSGPLRPDWYRLALAEQRENRAVVFTLRMAERIVGTTRFADFNPLLPAAELGWTWLDKAEHGSGLNASIKYLLLRYAFEEWQLVRLQLKTAASNLRSQRAIEKLGAQREGLLRNHRRLADGRLDDTILYSITDREWPAVKSALEAGSTG